MANQKVSLIHQSIIPPNEDNGETYNTFVSRIYKAPHIAGTLLLDLSAVQSTYTDMQCLILLKEQQPSVHAVNLWKDGTSKYLEIYIEKEVDTNDLANTGLNFKKERLVVLSCKAIDHVTKVTRIKLTHLPMLTKEKVLQGLQESLSPFGRVVDIGLCTERTTGFYMGTGYAIIARNPDEKFLPIEHNGNISHELLY